MSVTSNILKVQNVQGVITSIKDRGSDAKLLNQEYTTQSKIQPVIDTMRARKATADEISAVYAAAGLFSTPSDKPFDMIPLDVVVRYSPEASTTITANPTQMGISVNDHVYENPTSMTITFGISDIRGTLARLTGIVKSFSSLDSLKNPQTPSRSLLDLLFRAKQEHTLLALDDGLHTYTNMVITNIAYDKDKTTYRSLVATVTLQQFIFVRTLEDTISSTRADVLLVTLSKFAENWNIVNNVMRIV